MAFQDKSLDPKSTPPASAPPPPPPQDPLLPPSYHRGSRALEHPKIRSEASPATPGWLGNSSLLPNIGLTNSYDTSCVAIHESIQQIRLGICMMCGLTFLIVFFFWWWRFFALQWANLVVSLYLGFLAALLGTGEFIALMGLAVATSRNESGEESLPEEPKENPWSEPLRHIQNNFGFLFHPIGKPSFLLLMATLCWALGGIWEFLLGFCYFFIAIVLAVLSQQSEFRRNYFPPLPDLREEDDTATYMSGLRAATWSYFSTASSTPSERTSLLRNHHHESM